jgi:hypothetical protein
MCALPLVGCTCRGADGGAKEVVPEELADEASLTLLADWSSLPRFAPGRYRQQSSEDRGRTAGAHQPLWDRGNRDMNNFVCAGAQAEPGPRGTPFLLDHERCAEPYVRGYVLARFEGSGRLARMWLTAASIRSAAADREVLRIYVDEQQAPLVQVPLSKALDGSAGEAFGRPFGAGSGRHLAWYYPVVFSSKLIVALDRLDHRDLYYHQTAVVLDPEPTERTAATSRLPVRDRALDLLRSSAPIRGAPQARRLSLRSGEEQIVHRLEGPATIVQVRVTVADDRLAQLEELQLAVRWDGRAEPAIETSLGELFASWHSVPGLSSPALGAVSHGGSTELSLRLPMPFRRSAEWRLTHRGDGEVDLELRLDTVPRVPAGDWGSLHVQTFDTSRSARRAVHPLAEVEGRGRLAGVCMMLHGGAAKMRGMRGHPMNFLEGDEVGTIDGERAIAGTGSEDYFNGSFYFEDGPSADPFAQVWGIVPQDPERPRTGRVTACRWHVLGDTIDFERSLDLGMEVGPGDPSVLQRYRSIAFVYR